MKILTDVHHQFYADYDVSHNKEGRRTTDVRVREINGHCPLQLRLTSVGNTGVYPEEEIPDLRRAAFHLFQYFPDQCGSSKVRSSNSTSTISDKFDVSHPQGNQYGVKLRHLEPNATQHGPNQ